ncbi:MAG: S1 RNA-binding domain-containing protein [Synergistaceae bacterium]|nr:S1 RNA-binding domain-containing protein [Synergistaceae bacterium]
MGEAITHENLPAELSAGEIVDCTVEQIMPYGAFVRIAKNGRKGMIHISELSYSFVKNITDVLNIQDKIKAKIIKIDERGRIDLSLKQTQEPPQQTRQSRPERRPQSAGRPFVPRSEARPPREREGAPREFRDFRVMQENFREANPEDSDSFEKKMASFLKTSEAKITDLNTRNSARAGRPSRRRQNSRDY